MLSVVIPARNEALAIGQTIDDIRAALAANKVEHEIIVVDDGSTDDTGAIARGRGVAVIRHPASGGYGKSLKDGIRRAKYDLIAITDADGTYPNQRLPDLLRLIDDGFDMAVGARTGAAYRGSLFKRPARRAFIWLSEYAAGRKIADINSGLRIFRKELVFRYIHTISDGFSFTTTITLAAMLNGHFVAYTPIDYYERVGKSYVRYWRDTLRSLQIIISTILYYNPLKLFLLIVNTLLIMTLACVVTCVLSQHPKVLALSSSLAAGCFAAAFIVGALGLTAELSRTVNNAGER